MKFIIKLALAAALLIAAAVSGFAQAAQTEKKEPTFDALHWACKKTGVDVFLVERGAAESEYNLIVVSERKVTVVYRTERNSTYPVRLELAPVKTVGTASFYQVKHSFSRTTIWMALDFAIDGEPHAGLTRTFYNSFSEIVPNEQFAKPGPQK